MDEERKRRYYSISDVSRMLDLKAHVLRYWESEFSMLRPRKNRAGNRAYTERDIKIVQLIKGLVHDEGYTIEGARKRLKTHREIIDEQVALPLDETLESPGAAKESASTSFDGSVSGRSAEAEKEIREIRAELVDLKDMVKDL